MSRRRVLALTTKQVQLGLLVAHRHGPLFVPWQAVAVIVAVFLLALLYHLALDTVTAASFLRRLVAVNLQYHADIFRLGVQVIIEAITGAVGVYAP